MADRLRLVPYYGLHETVSSLQLKGDKDGGKERLESYREQILGIKPDDISNQILSGDIDSSVIEFLVSDYQDDQELMKHLAIVLACIAYRARKNEASLEKQTTLRQ